MTEISPRWEWRTFGERFGAAERTFAALSPERVQESDELYLLSEAGGDTVKVRAELMDVKHLEHVNDGRSRAMDPGEEGLVPPSGGRGRIGAREPARGRAASFA